MKEETTMKKKLLHSATSSGDDGKERVMSQNHNNKQNGWERVSPPPQSPKMTQIRVQTNTRMCPQEQTSRTLGEHINVHDIIKKKCRTIKISQTNSLELVRDLNMNVLVYKRGEDSEIVSKNN
ncbi:hypothetical protein B9Z55_019015 [Caenorhabditis nigoni]|uniref:Uncharacterized protein n=1 Tax=Caenorhabditis nigoni TaxID=1611254 RepID=A0A2G5THA3_9PELO|nr:hypothetical protein B9Z55_019015 [Caenorhabditis nigoni]